MSNDKYMEYLLNKTRQEIEQELFGDWTTNAPINPATTQESLTMESLEAAVKALGPRPPTVEIWVNSAVPLQDETGKGIPAIQIDRREASRKIGNALPMLAELLSREPIHPEVVIMMHPSRYLPIAALIPENIPVHWAGGIEKLEEEEE